MTVERGSRIDLGHVAGLFVYPLKSAQGLALAQASLDAFGVQHDRRWMCVDALGRALTQRTHPLLARVTVSDVGDGWDVAISPHDTAWLPHSARAGSTRQVSIHADQCMAVAGPPAASALLSALLGETVHVVHLPESEWRPMPTAQYAGAQRLAFTDDNPLLLTSLASLAVVNAHAGEAVPMDRFRANIVIDGLSPWVEDDWTHVDIGGVPFTPTNRCGRCVVTTTDQRRGTRSPEPMASMQRHRLIDGRVRFGRNLVHEARGTLHVGDTVVGR